MFLGNACYSDIYFSVFPFHLSIAWYSKLVCNELTVNSRDCSDFTDGGCVYTDHFPVMLFYVCIMFFGANFTMFMSILPNLHDFK